MVRCRIAPARPPAGFAHIDMGVGPERNNDVGEGTHLLTNIRMRVEGDGYGDLSPERGSNTAQNFAVAVFTEIKDHSPMQAEENAVKVSTRTHGDDGIAKPLESGAFHFGARPRRRAKDMLDLPAIVLVSISETGQFGICVASRPYGVISHQNIVILE